MTFRVWDNKITYECRGILFLNTSLKCLIKHAEKNTIFFRVIRNGSSEGNTDSISLKLCFF